MKKIIIITILILNITTMSFAQSCEKLANSLDYLKSEVELTTDDGLQDIYRNIFVKYFEIFFDKCIINKKEK